jgi:sugar lactone lactonase YvrE
MNRTTTEQRTLHSRYWPLPDRLGCFAFCESGQLLLGLAKGLYLAELDLSSDAPPVLTPVMAVEAHEPRTRINDGRCDRAGNFVFGTLNEDRAREPIGSFYQYSARHDLRRLKLGGVAIPNSICFSIDGGTLYYCDTQQPRILCCDYDADSATVSNSRLFAEVNEGSPDGSTLDAEGYLWNAQWGAARVVRYAPQGEIDRIVTVPTMHPSCVAFGGEQLDQLFITTAREGLGDEALQRVPESGGVYRRYASGFRGLPESRMHL